MKRNFSLKTFLLLCLVTLSLNAFSQTTYEISSEVISKLDNISVKDAVYQVDVKEVDYYPMVDTLVYSDNYERLLNDLKNLQPEYDEFMQSKTQDSLNRVKEIKIKDNIMSYLSSKNKTLLDDAQKLAEELKFDFQIKSSNINVKPRQVYIKDGKKYASNKILNDYLNIIEQRSTKYRPTYESNEVKEYINTKQQIQDFQEERKYKTVQTASKEPHKKSLYFAGTSIDINQLNGSFDELSSQIYISCQTHEYFTKHELTEQLGQHVTCGKNVWPTFSLIQDRNTKNYYVLNTSITNTLKNLQGFEKLRHHLEGLGYQTEYLSSGHLIVRTKNYLVGNLKILIDDSSNAKKWLTQLEDNYSQLQSSITKSNEYKSKLDKYIQLHNVQRNRMSSSDINAWTKVTNEAIQIAQKLFSLRYESGGVPLTIEFIKEPQYTEEFNYNLSYSRNVLGL